MNSEITKLGEYSHKHCSPYIIPFTCFTTSAIKPSQGNHMKLKT